MALVQVANHTMTSAASTVTITGITTNDPHVLFYRDVYMTSDGAVPAWRLTKASDDSANSSSNYDNARMNIYSSQGKYDGANEGLTSFSSIGTGTTSSECHQGMLTLINCTDSSSYTYSIWQQIMTTETPEYIGPHGGGSLKVNEAHNGVQFFANTGNIANGRFTIYKVV
tara:strand:+ start:591 stop:1100 length:510 start_codon:yes stop_codon:yes gene_type:complete